MVTVVEIKQKKWIDRKEDGDIEKREKREAD